MTEMREIEDALIPRIAHSETVTHGTRVAAQFSRLNPNVSAEEFVAGRLAAVLHGLGTTTGGQEFEERLSQHAVVEGTQLLTAAGAGTAMIDRVASLMPRVHNSAHLFSSAKHLALPDDNGGPQSNATLKYLRAANAVVHASDLVSEIPQQRWAASGLPAGGVNGETVPQWSRTVHDNTCLTSQVFMLDCHDWILQARDEFLELSSQLDGLCGLSDSLPFITTRVGFRAQSLARVSREKSQFRMNSVSGFTELDALLREVTLKYDQEIRPYELARAKLSVVSTTQVRPLSLYALRSGIDYAIRLHDLFMSKYCMSPLWLSGLVHFCVDNAERVIAPPVLEYLPAEDEGGVGLVDGLHRFLAARELGIERCWAVSIENASVPLVPLPVNWREIKIFQPGESPDEKEKRRYRFDAWDSFPKSAYPSATPENFRYFFYRDLGNLGSSGIRSVPQKKLNE